MLPVRFFGTGHFVKDAQRSTFFRFSSVIKQYASTFFGEHNYFLEDTAYP